MMAEPNAPLNASPDRRAEVTVASSSRNDGDEDFAAADTPTISRTNRSATPASAGTSETSPPPSAGESYATQRRAILNSILAEKFLNFMYITIFVVFLSIWGTLPCDKPLSIYLLVKSCVVFIKLPDKLVGHLAETHHLWEDTAWFRILRLTWSFADYFAFCWFLVGNVYLWQTETCQNTNRFIYWLVFADTVFTWTVMILSFALIVFATVMRRRSESLETEMANLASLTAGGNTRGLSPRELARLRTFSFRMTDKLTQAERASKQGTLLRTLQRRAGGGGTPTASPALDEHDSERHGLRTASGEDAKRDGDEMPPVTEIMIISEEEYARIDEEHKREAEAAATASGRSSTPEREKKDVPAEKQPKRINTGGSSTSAKLRQESQNQIVTETRFSPTFNRYPDPLWVSGGSSKSDGIDVVDNNRSRSLTADSSLTHVDKEESRSPSEALPGATSSSNVASSFGVEQDELGKKPEVVEDGHSSASNEAAGKDAPPAGTDTSGADAAARAIDSSYETCAICYCAYETGDRLRELACGHVFHKECIDEWLRGDPETGIGGHRTCPLCVREAVRPEDRDAEWLGEVEGEEIDEEDPEAARRRRRRRRRMDRLQLEREVSEEVSAPLGQAEESAPTASVVAERPSEGAASSSSAALHHRPHRRGNSAGPRASTSSMQTASSEEDTSVSRRARWRRTWTFVGRRRNAEVVGEGSTAVRTPSFGVESDSGNAATSRSTPDEHGSVDELQTQQQQQQQQRGSRILDSSITEEAEEENQEQPGQEDPGNR
ncbi:hypothetical protein BJ742DRAFT_859492 [Cladochytrium replicatum]|nr:hypothetical protein BJ742DRAFT_859492 [Cladochytrium replicatum]